MGNQASHPSTSSAPAADSELFQLCVLEGGKAHPRALHYVDPTGKPVWSSKEVRYLSTIPSFEAAQRICRQIIMQPQYASGTRIQFYKGPHRIKHSTVVKP